MPNLVIRDSDGHLRRTLDEYAQRHGHKDRTQSARLILESGLKAGDPSAINLPDALASLQARLSDMASQMPNKTVIGDQLFLSTVECVMILRHLVGGDKSTLAAIQKQVKDLYLKQTQERAS